MNRSNNSLQVTILIEKVSAYQNEIAASLQTKNKLEDRLAESREATNVQDKMALAALHERLRLLECYPVATHPGDDHKRQKDALVRPYTALEAQLYQSYTPRKTWIVLLSLCMFGLICIPIRQTGITILCALIIIPWLLFIHTQKKRLRKGKKALRDLIIREWTRERESLERSILQQKNQVGKELPEQRLQSNNIQSINHHLQKLELDLALAKAELKALTR